MIQTLIFFAIMTSSIYYMMGPFMGSIWLFLGILGDIVCQKGARLQKIPYELSTLAVCYLIGPLIIPVICLLACFIALRLKYKKKKQDKK